jgi:hypothetical protein
VTAARGSGKAVVVDPDAPGGLRLVSVSASQIRTYRTCQQLWAWDKVHGLRQESTGAQNTGTMIHSELEDYLIKGALKEDPHPSVRKAVDDVRFPKPALPEALVEYALDEPVLYIADPAGGLPTRFNGFVDYASYDTEAQYVRILDHKSTSKAQYMKTAEALRSDVQMIIYAKHALARWPEARYVSVGHTYFFTTVKKGRFEIVETLLTADEVEGGWASVVETVVSMLQTVAAGAMEPERNWEACDNQYGRPCAHWARCHSEKGTFDQWEPDEPPVATPEEALIQKEESNEP